MTEDELKDYLEWQNWQCWRSSQGLDVLAIRDYKAETKVFKDQGLCGYWCYRTEFKQSGRKVGSAELYVTPKYRALVLSTQGENLDVEVNG